MVRRGVEHVRVVESLPDGTLERRAVNGTVDRRRAGDNEVPEQRRGAELDRERRGGERREALHAVRDQHGHAGVGDVRPPRRHADGLEAGNVREEEAVKEEVRAERACDAEEDPGEGDERDGKLASLTPALRACPSPRERGEGALSTQNREDESERARKEPP